MVEFFKGSRRRTGILLATMALAFALLPGTALASAPAQAGSGSVDTVLVDGAAGSAFVAPIELGRQNPEFKIVCERTRDLSAVVCTRWAPSHQCKVPRGEEVGLRNCIGNGPNARVLL